MNQRREGSRGIDARHFPAKSDLARCSMVALWNASMTSRFDSHTKTRKLRLRNVLISTSCSGVVGSPVLLHSMKNMKPPGSNTIRSGTPRCCGDLNLRDAPPQPTAVACTNSSISFSDSFILESLKFAARLADDHILAALSCRVKQAAR